jgi:hypothetical protein
MKLTLKLKHAIAAILLMLSFAAPVAAGPYGDAVAAHSRHDYATALWLFRPLADQGSAMAQFFLGAMYYEGQGVPQSDAEAAKWFRKAAEQGEDTSQDALGSIYFTGGDGIAQNYAEAMKWFRKAADQGNPAAQNSLGMMYEKGHSVPMNFILAYMWYSLSANDPAYKLWAKDQMDKIAQHMAPSQIAEAQKLAREWSPTKQPSQ